MGKTFLQSGQYNVENNVLLEIFSAAFSPRHKNSGQMASRTMEGNNEFDTVLTVLTDILVWFVANFQKDFDRYC